MPTVKMQEAKRIEIMHALQDYIKGHGISQEMFAAQIGVNVSYINTLMNDRMVVGTTQIGDKYYVKIADAIGMISECDQSWRHVDSVQYELILEELIDAKTRGMDKIIVGDTGCGKSYTVGQFFRLRPDYTYRVTVSNEHLLRHILNELGDTMNIKHNSDIVTKMNQIGRFMRKLKLERKQPIIIIDEAENLKPRALKAIKALYDRLDGYCPIVLIGTSHLTRMIDTLREKDEPGIPQLYRRFKAGIREIKSINKDTMFDPFLSIVEDDNVRDMIHNLADNYGEINRYVEPAIRESRAMGVPLDERFFRMLNKI